LRRVAGLDTDEDVGEAVGWRPVAAPARGFGQTGERVPIASNPAFPLNGAQELLQPCEEASGREGRGPGLPGLQAGREGQGILFERIETDLEDVADVFTAPADDMMGFTGRREADRDAVLTAPNNPSQSTPRRSHGRVPARLRVR